MQNINMSWISIKTGTGKASRYVGTVRLWVAVSVILSTFIYVCRNTTKTKPQHKLTWF